MTTLRTAAQQALEAMGSVGADWICEASHHAERDQHKIGEPCPLQQRWHVAYQALRAALAEPCPCGDKPADQCPGEWEPGCDLGNNPKYAKRVEMTPKELAASIKRGDRWKVAEPVKEPVAWIDDSGHPKHLSHLQSATERRLYGPLRPLYTAPPQRKPLSEDEIAQAMYRADAIVTGPMQFRFAREIERAHDIT